MKREIIIVIIFVLLAFTLACTISYEGISDSDDPSIEELIKRDAEIYEKENKEMEPESSSMEGSAVVEEELPTTESDSAVALPQNGTESRTYSVTATNNGCICSVDGNDVEKTFIFNDFGLEVFHSPGVSTEYLKTGENEYTRSYIGYYILDGEEVPEEKKDVITFTNTGFTDEHFSGDLTSPCCVHTFTNK